MINLFKRIIVGFNWLRSRIITEIKIVIQIFRILISKAPIILQILFPAFGFNFSFSAERFYSWQFSSLVFFFYGNVSIIIGLGIINLLFEPPLSYFFLIRPSLDRKVGAGILPNKADHFESREILEGISPSSFPFWTRFSKAWTEIEFNFFAEDMALINDFTLIHKHEKYIYMALDLR